MITALDTNILAALLYQEDTQTDVADALLSARREGELLICGTVYAELLAGPQGDEAALDRFLSSTDIQTDWQINEALWREAGRAYHAYAQRRRTSGGGQPRRLLADFVIGAHALGHAGQLLTLDAQQYQTGFPALKLLTL